MSGMKKLGLLLVLALICFNGIAQSNEAEKDSVRFVQLTGIVITDSLYRVPFTRVADKTTRRGSIADYYGYFALVVHPGDTIEFSSLGYKRKTYIVPDTTTLRSISLVQVMTPDTVNLDPVDVYPWPSREEFADAFVNMDIPDDDLRRAQERLSPQEMAFVGSLLTADGGAAYSAYRAQQAREAYTRGQTPVNNLLNPAAWKEFIDGLGTGKYQISN